MRILVGVAIVAAVVLISMPAAALVDCNPTLRENPDCPEPGICLRKTGTCGAFGIFNAKCIEKSETFENPNYDVDFCNYWCTGGVGSCLTEACNVDNDCVDDLLCLGGLCVPDPFPAPDPVTVEEPIEVDCDTNIDCCRQEVCQAGTCVPVECVVDDDCLAREVCGADFTCEERCVNSFWVEGPGSCGECRAEAPDGCDVDPEVCSLWEVCGTSDFGTSHCVTSCTDLSPYDELTFVGGAVNTSLIANAGPPNERLEPIEIGSGMSAQWTGEALAITGSNAQRETWTFLTTPETRGSKPGPTHSRVELDRNGDGRADLSLGHDGLGTLVTEVESRHLATPIAQLADADLEPVVAEALCATLGMRCPTAPARRPATGSCGPDITGQVVDMLAGLRAQVLGWSVFDLRRQCHSAAAFDVRSRPTIPLLAGVTKDPGAGTCGATVEIAGACFQAETIDALLWGAVSEICDRDLLSTLAWQRVWGLTVAPGARANDLLTLGVLGFDPSALADPKSLAARLAGRVTDAGGNLEDGCRVSGRPADGKPLAFTWEPLVR